MTSAIPAKVSGPAQYSQRTDGGQPVRDLPNAKYGENKAFVDQQMQAPLANGPDRPTSPAGGPGVGVSAGPVAAPTGPPVELTGLAAPTTRPGEPVTAGAALGPGVGPPGAPKVNVSPGQLSAALAPYFAGDETGALQEFAWHLSEMGL